MTDQEHYAFGTDEYNGVSCPMRAAGMDSNHSVADRYDSILRNRNGRGVGVVLETNAKKAFLIAIAQMRSGVADIWEAEQAAKKLGWL